MNNIRDLLFIIKDKVVSKSRNHAMNLSLLRATTRDYSTPPRPKHIAALLSYGLGSRATAATAILALMDRLGSSNDSSVSIKCLVIVHHIIKHGSFILRDQLTAYPTTGGRNHLNLSNFRDSSSLLAWELSSWVRWYARYLEHHIFISRLLGFFVSSTSNALETQGEKDKLKTQTNIGLIYQVGSLAGLIEESCKKPEPLLRSNTMVDHIMDLVREDILSLIDVISDTAEELKYRLDCLSFHDSIELASVLKRLDGCKHGVAPMFYGEYNSIERLWLPLVNIKQKVAIYNLIESTNSRVLSYSGEEEWSQSHRFHGRIVKHDDQLKFSSERFHLNGF